MPDQSLSEFRLFTVERVGFRPNWLTNLTARLNLLSQTVHTQKAPPEIRTGKLLESQLVLLHGIPCIHHDFADGRSYRIQPLTQLHDVISIGPHAAEVYVLLVNLAMFSQFDVIVEKCSINFN
jgi:hypothetical protein